MSTTSDGRHMRLTIDLEPELRRRVEAAAEERQLSVRDYVISALRDALKRQPGQEPLDDAEWSQLSAAAFARDWESDADAVYDDLA